MKVLYCGKCGDIRAFECHPVPCSCGNMRVRWLDPSAGTFRVKAHVKHLAFIIGLHNGMLRAATNGVHTHEQWRDLQEKIVNNSPGYIFAKEHCNSWACIIRVGQTSDGDWEEDSKPHWSEVKQDGYTAYISEDTKASGDYRMPVYTVELFDPVWKTVQSRVVFHDVQVAKEYVPLAITAHKNEQSNDTRAS